MREMLAMLGRSDFDQETEAKITRGRQAKRRKKVFETQRFQRTLRSKTVLATESPLKMRKNAFYFFLEAFFVLKIFNFLFWIFGHVEKRFDQKAVNFTTWETKNCNTHIAQYLKK